LEITAKSADPERFEPEPELLGFDRSPPESSVTARSAAVERQRREALEQARALASDGSWALAAPLFRSVIAETTDDVEALRGLGLVALHGNRPAEAVAWLSRARYYAPDSVPILAELGLAQKRCGLLTDAIASYRRALTVTPHDTALWSNLGRAEREAGRVGSAILAFRRALQIDPAAAGIWSMLSNALREAGRLTEALRAAQQALRHDPWLHEAHLNEGAALHGTGALTEAVVSYFVATTDPALRPAALGTLQVALRTLGERARSHPVTRLALTSLAEPRNPAPLLELGRSQAAQRPLSALLCFERALSLGPNPSAERDLARLLWDLGRVEPALERLLRAIAGDRSDVLSYRLLAEWLAVPNKINLRSQSWQRLFAECPNDATALFNLGVALRRRGYPMQGTALHRRALGLDPLRLSGHVNLGAALSSQGAIPEAIAVYRRALEIEPRHWEAASNLLFSLHLDPAQTPESIFEEHRRIGALLSASLPPAEPLAPPRPLAGRRLRIGYVSPDFRSHPVAHFLEPVLREHDRSAFEIFCYSDVEHPDEVTARLSGLAAHFVACAGFSDQKLRERIVGDGIDILVDLAGHTGRNRLPVFASKPSPVQVAWLGYFDTTGIPAVDYRIADEPSLPASAERYFTERVVRLPRSANCFLPPAGPAPSPPPCLTRSGITFGCFNNPAKIGREVVRAFARVLHAVPGSRLLLKYLAFNDPGMRTHYRSWFKQEGIAAERIAFEGPSSLERFLESFSRVDIALDPFPYSGETTALHTLWMGVPLVALEGPTLVQRLASRVLHIAGLPDWIAHDEDEYVRIALDLAGDFERLARLRRELRPRLEACPLLDHEGVTRELEAAYQGLWRRACSETEAPGRSA
jgi:protein O-GlcNAc transferase